MDITLKPEKLIVLLHWLLTVREKRNITKLSPNSSLAGLRVLFSSSQTRLPARLPARPLPLPAHQPAQPPAHNKILLLNTLTKPNLIK